MNVEFFFDFGSPNAYMCHRVIPKIEARTGARFKYVPVLLGGIFKLTGNQSPARKSCLTSFLRPLSTCPPTNTFSSRRSC